MRILLALVVLALVAGAVATWYDHGPASAGGASEACFGRDAEAAFASAVERAQRTVRVRAPTLGRGALAALTAARKRGVATQAVLGRGGDATAEALYQAGVEVYLDRRHALAPQVLVVDDETVAVGDGEGDEASLLVQRSPALAASYLADLRQHLAHAQALEVAAPAPASTEGQKDEGGLNPFQTTHRDR